MTLTPRQWMIVFALIIGFGVAAIAVRSSDTPSGGFDTAAWCAEASVLEGWSPLVDGSATTADADDFENFKQALYSVEGSLPPGLGGSVNQLANYSLVAKQSFDDEAWPAVYDTIRTRLDDGAVDAALADVTAALQACGISF